MSGGAPAKVRSRALPLNLPRGVLGQGRGGTIASGAAPAPWAAPDALLIERIAEIAAAVPAHQLVTLRRSGRPPYLTRYHLGDFADGGHLYLHNIHGPDEDAELHSHPWGACALVLVGGYSELRRVRVGSVDGVAERVLRRGDLNVIELDTFHRIASVEPHTWTLLATTPKAQSWSFWNSVTGETLHHAAFLAGKRGPATRRP